MRISKLTLITLVAKVILITSPYDLFCKNNVVRIQIEEIIPETRAVICAFESNLNTQNKPVKIIFYALPNGNTIEQTEGAALDSTLLNEGDGWRYNIQHIAAQWAFISLTDTANNYVMVYLESKTRAWTSYAAKYEDIGQSSVILIDSIKNYISNRLFNPSLCNDFKTILVSHSGGGRFVFSYIAGVQFIPKHVERIIFIDSNYGYDSDLHANKILNWLKTPLGHGAVTGRYLGVLAYVDTTVLIDSKPIVSSKGGTGYRSHLMARDFIARGLSLQFVSDSLFKRWVGEGCEISIKENPTGKIYHTILVERNGLIHSILNRTQFENRGYVFWGERAYEHLIKNAKL